MLSIDGIRKNILNKSYSIKELIETQITKIKAENPKINASFNLLEEEAIKQALYWDDLIDKKKINPSDFPLLGVPIFVKENIHVAGVESTAASGILKSFYPYKDATCIEKLRKQGAIFIAKANCDEMAMGSSNQTSVKGPVLNPYNTDYVPGGSSGGSAASISAGWASIALGTDTGGSIRQPAAWCGIYGLKPSYGRVSRYGAVSFSSSLDSIGPLASSIQDIALALQAMAGFDALDSSSSQMIVPDYLKKMKEDFDLKNTKIAVIKDYQKLLKGTYLKDFDSLINRLKKAGVRCKEIEMPELKLCPFIYAILAFSEAASNFARYSGVVFGYQKKGISSIDEMIAKTRTLGFGSEVKKRLYIGAFFASKENYDLYLKAQSYKKELTARYQELFKDIDFVLSPTSLKPAYKISESLPLEEGFRIDELTIGQNFTGLPAISIPFSKDDSVDKMPLGLQITSNYMQEDRLLQFISSLERKIL